MVELKVIEGGKKDFVVGQYEGVFDIPTLKEINKKISEAPGFIPETHQTIRWDGLIKTSNDRPVPYEVEEEVNDVGIMVASHWRAERNQFIMDWAKHAWKSEALREVAKEFPYLLVAEIHAYNPVTKSSITNARTVNKYDFEGVYVQIFLNESAGDHIVFEQKWGDETVASFTELERATPVAGNALASDSRHYLSNAYPTKDFERKYVLVVFASKEEIQTRTEQKKT